MNVLEISEDKLVDFKMEKHPAAVMIATEKKWFISPDNKLIGIIIQDTLDKDWGYVILAADSDDVYRPLDIQASLDTSNDAESRLRNSMSDIFSKEKKEEVLFTLDEKDEKPSSLIVTNINDEIKKYFQKHPDKLYDLEPRKFEELIASILEDLGFSVELTKATRDGGKDIIASVRTAITSFLIYVECKRYAPENKIGVGLVREVLGVHSLRKPAKSMIVTTSFFTKDAVKEANTFENQLDLKDFNNIKEWLQRYERY